LLSSLRKIPYSISARVKTLTYVRLPASYPATSQRPDEAIALGCISKQHWYLEDNLSFEVKGARVIRHSFQVEVGCTQRRVHKKLVQTSLGHHRGQRGFFIKGIKGLFDQFVRIMQPRLRLLQCAPGGALAAANSNTVELLAGW
jgi:hypothetical protein